MGWEWPVTLIVIQRASRASGIRVGRGLNYTIVRPGRLTEEPPLEKVEIAEKLKDFGDISREDVAKVLSETTRRALHNKEFDVISGPTPIRDALDGL